MIFHKRPINQNTQELEYERFCVYIVWERVTLF